MTQIHMTVGYKTEAAEMWSWKKRAQKHLSNNDQGLWTTDASSVSN